MRQEPLSIALIVAYDRGRAIGRNGALPWHLPADLRRFRALTLGHAVLMGRRTAEAIGRPLAGRRNLVLSRSDGRCPAGMERVRSPEEALAHADAGTLWVIGGEQVYRQFLPLAERLEITEVGTETPDADAWFPPVAMTEWECIACEERSPDAENAYPLRFLSLRRRR